MKKITLIGADWCPMTQETKKFWQDLKQKYKFQYKYVSIDSEEGKKLVQKYSITSIPKTVVQNRIVFDGVPNKKKAIKFLKQSGSLC